MNTHHRKLERMYLSAPIHQTVYPSTEIQIEENRVVISMDVDDRLHHAAGAMHGSIYFKLLDDAAYFAVSARVEGVFVLTKSFSLEMKRPFITGKITATGQLIKAEGDHYIASSSLVDERGKLLAEGHGVFVKGKTALTPAIGYR